MIPLVDYHMHTPLCGHALGEPYEYAEQAILVGLKEIGFSDHAPFIKGPLPGITMQPDELPLYHRMVERVRGEFSGRLSIKIGIEADFLPGFEKETRQLLSAYPYDYVYGSVHFIKDWAFDSPDERDKWDETDVNRVYSAYYNLLRDTARSGLFDIMAHVDLVKKFGHRPTKDMSDEILQTARVFKENNVVIEINTSGLRKDVREIYPSLDALSIYAREGVDITFGSDAHLNTDVGKDFDQAGRLAIAAGYTDYVTFKGRKIETRLPLK
jgi:histidinol-phosphatase (PHP family)